MKCELCGGPIHRDNVYGVCWQTPACKREQKRRYHAANTQKVREANRRYHAANKEKISERKRRYYAAKKNGARTVGDPPTDPTRDREEVICAECHSDEAANR
ncbi:MAG: hypothetical protein ABII82_06010 [Verrucomicrobiota bacterium]